MFGKHTPGPWTVSGQAARSRYITVSAEGCGRVVARIPFTPERIAERSPSLITDAADAALIAAAPSMLEALRKAETILAVDRERRARKGLEDTIGASVLALVRSVIAEAEG